MGDRDRLGQAPLPSSCPVVRRLWDCTVTRDKQGPVAPCPLTSDPSDPPPKRTLYTTEGEALTGRAGAAGKSRSTSGASGGAPRDGALAPCTLKAEAHAVTPPTLPFRSHYQGQRPPAAEASAQSRCSEPSREASRLEVPDHRALSPRRGRLPAGLGGRRRRPLRAVLQERVELEVQGLLPQG